MELASVEPSVRAREIAGDEADPRVIELILRESASIVRRRGAFLICETHHGFVCAAAGVDRSNTGAGDVAVLLPVDPDASARRLREAFGAIAEVGVIVTDSFGRPFRMGTTGVAVGCAGIAPVRDPPGRATTPDTFLQRADPRRRSDRVGSSARMRPLRPRSGPVVAPGVQRSTRRRAANSCPRTRSVPGQRRFGFLEAV